MYLEVAIVWCKLWSLGELSSEGGNKVGHQAGGRVVSLAAVHNAYIEQLDSSVYNEKWCFFWNFGSVLL